MIAARLLDAVTADVVVVVVADVFHCYIAEGIKK